MLYEVITDDGPDPATYAMRAVQRRGTSAWFAAVYQVGATAPGAVSTRDWNSGALWPTEASG